MCTCICVFKIFHELLCDINAARPTTDHYIRIFKNCFLFWSYLQRTFSAKQNTSKKSDIVDPTTLVKLKVVTLSKRNHSKKTMHYMNPLI